jgi:membrane protein DedA with SNARE-associated domain
MRGLEWIIHLLGASGYLGVAGLMFVADVVFVVPSEIITPLAGFVSIRYDLSYWGVVFASTVGSVAGGIPWFYLGKRIQRHGLDAWLRGRRRVLGVPVGSIHQAQTWFGRHGGLAVVMARLLPGVRPAIGIPAGAAGMPFILFLGYSAAGTVVWTAALVLAGRILEEEFRRAGSVVVMIGLLVVSISLAGWGIWALLRQRRLQFPSYREGKLSHR